MEVATQEEDEEMDRLMREAHERANALQPDMVNEPPHYRGGEVECIDAIRAALGSLGFDGYCKGNALKYIWRCEQKGGDEDIRKAIWYLNKYLENK